MALCNRFWLSRLALCVLGLCLLSACSRLPVLVPDMAHRPAAIRIDLLLESRRSHTHGTRHRPGLALHHRRLSSRWHHPRIQSEWHSGINARHSSTHVRRLGNGKSRIVRNHRRHRRPPPRRPASRLFANASLYERQRRPRPHMERAARQWRRPVHQQLFIRTYRV